MGTEKNLDEQISWLFEDARNKLEEVEKESKKQLEKKKKQIVADLAKSLEGKIRTDTICIEIVLQLKDKVSEKYVRECLDEKYKNKIRSKNAKKQRKQEETDHIEDRNELAEQPPLNNEEIVIVEASGDQSLVLREGDHESEQFSNKDDSNSDEKTTPPPSTKPPLNKTQEFEQKSTKQSEIHGQKERPSYEELYSENLDLKEALKNSNQFIAANSIKTTPDKEAKMAKYQDNVIWKTIPELREYISPIILELGDGGRICVKVRTDKNTGKLISMTLGKTDLSSDESQEE